MFVHFLTAPFLFFCYAAVRHLSYPATRDWRLRREGIPLCGMALTLDPAYAGWRLRRRGIFVALHRATFVLCSFLSSLGKKETCGGRASPTEESNWIGISSEASSRCGLHSSCYAGRLFPCLEGNSFDPIG